MRNSVYPGLGWHERQHNAGRAKMAQLLRATQDSDELGIRDALQDLARWTRDHVQMADRMFAAHLRNYERERLAS